MITINIYYTGKNGMARAFAEEMLDSGLVKKIREEKGNLGYAYFFPAEDEKTVLLIDKWENQDALDFHHKTDMMKAIAALGEKYKLKMRVERFISEN